MSRPVRIQRSRAKGWRMPPGAIYVGRPGPHGNPFSVDIMSHAVACGLTTYGDPAGVDGDAILGTVAWGRALAEASVLLFRRYVEGMPNDVRAAWLAPLRGHDLACWCPLDFPCHADVELEFANR